MNGGRRKTTRSSFAGIVENEIKVEVKQALARQSAAFFSHFFLSQSLCRATPESCRGVPAAPPRRVIASRRSICSTSASATLSRQLKSTFRQAEAKREEPEELEERALSPLQPRRRQPTFLRAVILLPDSGTKVLSGMVWNIQTGMS